MFGFSGGHMVWMALWWVIGIGFLVALLWVLLRAVRPDGRDESPEAILRRRYAAGEISTEEFESRWAALRKG